MIRLPMTAVLGLVLQVSGCRSPAAPAMATPDPARFSVAVAELEGDRDGAMKTQILGHLEDLAGGAGREHVQVLGTPRTTGSAGAAATRVVKDHERARALLGTSGARAIVWGQILVHDGKRELALHMTLSPGHRDTGPAVSTAFDRDEFQLPVGRWSDVRDVLSLLVVSQASMLPHRRGQLAGDELEPFLRKVEAFTRSQAFQIAWSGDGRGAVHRHLGYAWAILGDQTGDRQALGAAVNAFEAGLADLDPDVDPWLWSRTQNNLGVSLTRLAEYEAGTAHLERARSAFAAALEVPIRERAPEQWAEIQDNLGVVLTRLGEREPGTDRLEEAITAYRAALEVHTRERTPGAWARTRSNLATALMRLGERTGDRSLLEEAVTVQRAVLEVKTRSRAPGEWAVAQSGLAGALTVLGKRTGDRSRLEEGVVAYHAALEVQTRERVPPLWAHTQHNLGIALLTLGVLEKSPTRLEQAVSAYRAALQVRTRERDPLRWAEAQQHLGLAHSAIAHFADSRAAGDTTPANGDVASTSAIHLCHALEAYLASWDGFRDPLPQQAEQAARGAAFALRTMAQKSVPATACGPDVAALVDDFTNSATP